MHNARTMYVSHTYVIYIQLKYIETVINVTYINTIFADIFWVIQELAEENMKAGGDKGSQ